MNNPTLKPELSKLEDEDRWQEQLAAVTEKCPCNEYIGRPPMRAMQVWARKRGLYWILP